LNDKRVTTVQIDKKTKSNDNRKSIQNIPETAHFYTPDNEIIDKIDKDLVLVKSTSNNDEAILKNEKENIVRIGILLNEKPLIKKQLNKNSYLSDIRKIIESLKNIPKDFVFKDQEGFEIPTDEEQSYKLSDILYNNKINITTETFGASSNNTVVPVSSLNITTIPVGSPCNITVPHTSTNNTLVSDSSLNNNMVISDISTNDTTDVSEQNVPIDGSKLLKNEEGKLKIYLYPNEEFNTIDESDAIAILVVGQTGSGKTTLLNSFVNALYGIKVTDDFRYIIINEGNLEQSEDQSKSQTSEVTIYNIKRTKRTPPIKIIDTPGLEIQEELNMIKKLPDKLKKHLKQKY
ncbi:hypothetical protein EDI_207400, partial [Entamoeba dispar SAW760]